MIHIIGIDLCSTTSIPATLEFAAKYNSSLEFNGHTRDSDHSTDWLGV